MGKIRHYNCVFSLEDLPQVTHQLDFFANKFLLKYDPLAYQCMEEWLDNKISTKQTVDIINYCRLVFIIPYTNNPACAGIV